MTTPPRAAPEVSTANPGYAVGQLARALTTCSMHADAATRARAEAKVARWNEVFQGMLSGALAIGARTPVESLPPWVTLEVLRGGFATGRALAGGALEAHELALAARLGVTDARDVGRVRAANNLHYLSEAGCAELRAMLESGCYRVDLPEEGALLVIAWLLARGHDARARDLLDAIGPFVGTLRFYPAPTETPAAPSVMVRLRTAGEVLREIREARTSPRVEAMNEALRYWGPLSDRVVALCLETVEGAWPAVRRAADGTPARDRHGNHEVDGGAPGRRFPADWRARARAVLEEYERERAAHRLSGRPDRRDESFARLRRFVARLLDAPGAVTAGEVASVRRVLAGVLARRGAPGSDALRALREAQARQTAEPTHGELAALLAQRLAGHPQDRGVSGVDELMAPVTDAESAAAGVPAGTAMPPHLRDKLLRCLEAPVDALVELGVIPSSEVLAEVAPQITSHVRAAGVTDRELAALYGAVYAAFRRRRSLLLLDLASQVRLEELPWVAAIDAFRSDELGAREQARQTLEQLVVLTLTAFPHVIVPNKLLQELRALATGAGLDLPLVDELAADIFMGTFSLKFVEAARTAARLLRGTLYERYYALPFERVLALGGGDDVAEAWGTKTSRGFAALCQELAAPQQQQHAGGSFVARNGTVVEQEQILTTHNLAVLFDALGLSRSLALALPAMARRCFAWACRQQQVEVDAWHARLQLVKNTAYAWRQMVFYLSLVSRGELEAFLAWARRHLAEQDEAFAARFAPALEGVEVVARGGAFDRDGRVAGGTGRRFLGWTVGKHWLLA